MYNPTQQQFNEIHTKIMQEILDNPGNEIAHGILLQLLVAYNDVCRAFDWEIEHKLGELK